MILLLIGITSFAQEEQENSAQKSTEDEITPLFLDINGDGINDLIRDTDGNGLPDDLDPLFVGPQAKCRWAWFRAIPDSAMTDSVAFKGWWEQTERPHNWLDAWYGWRESMEMDEFRRRLGRGAYGFSGFDRGIRGGGFDDPGRGRGGGGRGGGGRGGGRGGGGGNGNGGGGGGGRP